MITMGKAGDIRVGEIWTHETAGRYNYMRISEETARSINTRQQEEIINSRGGNAEIIYGLQLGDFPERAKIPAERFSYCAVSCVPVYRVLKPELSPEHAASYDILCAKYVSKEKLENEVKVDKPYKRLTYGTTQPHLCICCGELIPVKSKVHAFSIWSCCGPRYFWVCDACHEAVAVEAHLESHDFIKQLWDFGLTQTCANAPKGSYAALVYATAVGTRIRMNIQEVPLQDTGVVETTTEPLGSPVTGVQWDLIT